MVKGSVLKTSRRKRWSVVGVALTAVVIAPIAGQASIGDGGFNVRATSGEGSSQFVGNAGMETSTGSPGDGGGGDGGGSTPGETETPTVPALDNIVSLVIDTRIPGCTDIALKIPTTTVATFFPTSTVQPSAILDWGDGSPKAPLKAGDNLHSFSSAGEHTVEIEGTLAGFDEAASNNCITRVNHFGEKTGIITLAGMFKDSQNIKAVSSPPSSTLDMLNMFNGAKSFNGDLSGWKTENVKRFNSMFKGASSFNQDLSTWNTGSATDLTQMFSDATNFNGNIGSWNTSKVTKMAQMFNNASAFNQDLSGWDTSKVTIFFKTFTNATSFNGNVSTWNVSSVNNMESMFDGATRFNQNLSSWDVSKVRNFDYTFKNATSFNGDVTTWQTANSERMRQMFAGATSFDQDISGWNVSKSRGDGFSDGSGLSAEHRPTGFATR